MNEFIVVILSSFKFAMTFPVAILEFGFGFFKTLFLTNLGGMVGICFFTFLSEILIRLWRTFVAVPFSAKIGIPKKREGKLFSTKSRRIVRVKSSYGLKGIAIMTPLLLSIPVGAFIATRYFKKKGSIVFWLLAANLFWSVIYSGFYLFCYEAFRLLF